MLQLELFLVKLLCQLGFHLLSALFERLYLSLSLHEVPEKSPGVTASLQNLNVPVDDLKLFIHLLNFVIEYLVVSHQ